MPTPVEIFGDTELSPEEILRQLRPEALAEANRDVLRAILRRQWDELLDEPLDLDAKTLKEWKA